MVNFEIVEVEDLFRGFYTVHVRHYIFFFS